MSHRSVVETLDLHNDYGEYHREMCASQVTFGWLSPRVSFSTEYIEFSPDAPGRSRSARLSPEKKKQMDDEGENSDSSPTEFEFSLSSLNAAGNDTPGFIVPADELFHKGKLLPGFLPRHSTEKDDGVEFDASSCLTDCPLGYAATMSRQLNVEGIGGPASLGCVLGPSCLRTPKGPKWRELFGALRRVKSDSGRQRIPDESLLPPKTFQGRKKFFKQIFGAGSGPQQDPKQTTGSTPYVAPSTSRTSHISTVTDSTVSSASQGKSSWDSSSTSTRHSSRGSSGVSAAAVDFRSKAAPVYPPPSTSTEPTRSDFRGKSTNSQSSDGFTFNPTRARARPSSSGSSSSNTNAGRVSPIKAPARGANFGRSPSGRVIVRGLDRVASGGRSSASLQDQVRALRSREIRRSPDRSAYSNVRVTPVLNVPACMGPVLRGATKAGKGRLSNFRSFLTFKTKLPTSMSTAPIATR